MSDESPPVVTEAVVRPPAPQSAPPASPPPAWHERYKTLEVIKDNIEAFTIALIMALVIKHFCVEAFKIPTDSMFPTLYGEAHTGVGDRILVDKWAYLTSDPQRWDVVVFRFPLNKSKHFIKRVGGVGGEWFRIERGDIWTRRSKEAPWRIATKNRRPRDELYLPVFPPMSDEDDDDMVDRMDDTWSSEGDLTAPTLASLRLSGGEGSARYLPRITDASLADSFASSWGGQLVQDIRVRFRLEVSPSAWARVSWSTAEGHETTLELAGADAGRDSSVRLKRPGLSLREDLDVAMPRDGVLDVELECVDGRVHVHVGGKEVVVLDEQRAIDMLPAFDDFTQRLEFGAGGGEVSFQEIAVDRDVYYGDRGMEALVDGEDGLWIPEDHYFALGDNTDSSHDSRKWNLEVIPLKDGTSIRYYYDRNAPPQYDTDSTTVTDAEGIERTWRHADKDPAAPRQSYDERQPFVHRDLIVGRAFYIFWPLFPDPPGRTGMIH